ncbi:JAB domain-containing protein [Sphingobacterium paludis]|uniref:RadC-like JAB domain-containing protein n=1 Tax=Sphingobacterium paludis TaxID=1476465 RepID=A0A4R7CUE0_9SPHI|nr:JAB domain-containing protein [Sphingobacterium paludis]TDS06797.1 RadC-like JAB domain-containing protein [Sphingobacterium paludis]
MKNVANNLAQNKKQMAFANELALTYKKTEILADHQYHCINSSKKVAGLLRNIWDLDDLEIRESFYLLCFSSQLNLLGFQIVAKGGLDAVVVDLRILFSTALLCKSCSIVVAHNHPSGTLKPSGADRELTTKICEAGNLFDIRLNDHIILTADSYFSFRDEGLL